MFLAEVHGPEIRQFLGGTTMLQVSDAVYMCGNFPNLEEISCSMFHAEAVISPKNI